MTIHICGGSNSLMKQGWTRHLQDLRAPGEVVNLSIGATSSMTGLCRAMTWRDAEGRGMRPGDVMVWEYALNDVNHVRRGYSQKLMLRMVEHTIRFCIANGLRLAPVILTPRALERRFGRRPYMRKLLALFDDYGVPVFDMSSRYRRHRWRLRLPRSDFQDNAHYKATPRIMGFLAEGVSTLIDAAPVPRDRPPVLTEGLELHLEQGFCDRRVTSSILDLPAAPPAFRLPFAQGGRLAGLLVLSRPKGGAATLSLAGRSVEVSLTHAPKAHRRQLLKTIHLERAGGARWDFAPGDVLEVAPNRKAGKFYAEFGMAGKLGRSPRGKPGGLISAVIVERPAAQAPEQA